LYLFLLVWSIFLKGRRQKSLVNITFIKNAFKKNAFEKITLKKVLWFYVFLSILILLTTNNKYINFVAFSTGTILSCIRLIVMGKLSSNIVLPKKDIRITLLNLIYLLAILFFYGLMILAAINGVQFFSFFTAGFLLINFAVFANSVLELLGINKITYK
jgi:hypothetical protein